MPCGRTESKTDVFENFGRLRVPTKYFKTFAKKKLTKLLKLHFRTCSKFRTTRDVFLQEHVQKNKLVPVSVDDKDWPK